MIITIDGPAGAGKSTVAKRVARRLGLPYLDTGAMYRTCALKALRLGLTRPRDVLAMFRRTRLRFQGRRVFLDGREVTRAIRARRVTDAVRPLADSPIVRREMVQRQRALGRRGIVTEGRDQGSVVFPRADIKVYLTASVDERARRRHRQEGGSLLGIRRSISARDGADRRRRVGALRLPRGAVRIDSTRLTVAEVVDWIVGQALTLTGRPADN
ncbi:MAG: (d)CMP kinase [Planctomycetes bacterium]|nr:(d)CMP kinase [Planctomycetota bacterium]